MFDIGFQEILVIFVVALLVFGPRRLPELAQNLGKIMGELRRAMTGVKSEFDREMRQAELKNMGLTPPETPEARPEPANQAEAGPSDKSTGKEMDGAIDGGDKPSGA